MDSKIRSTLEMAERVREFSRAHPSADASYASVLATLDETIARLAALAQAEEGGYLVRRKSTEVRQQLRQRIARDLLRHLVTVAERAAAEEAGLESLFRTPARNGSHATFMAHAGKLLELAKSRAELLGRYGLAERLLPDLEEALAAMAASREESHEGLRGHVSARAALREASDAAKVLVSQLDGYNRYRFGSSSPQYAAWKSARNLRGPSGRTAAGGAEGVSAA